MTNEKQVRGLAEALTDRFIEPYPAEPRTGRRVELDEILP